MSEVTELIDALRSGDMSLNDVARRFREREWPSARSNSRPGTYLEVAAQAETDPGPTLKGSFEEVDTAHFTGRLNDEEYTVLREAALQAMRTQDNHP